MLKILLSFRPSEVFRIQNILLMEGTKEDMCLYENIENQVSDEYIRVEEVD